MVYEDEHLLAFKDLNPVAPVHVLIIPKVHMNSLNAVTPDHVTLMGHLLSTVKTIARECGVRRDIVWCPIVELRQGRRLSICIFILWADGPCSGLRLKHLPKDFEIRYNVRVL